MLQSNGGIYCIMPRRGTEEGLEEAIGGVMGGLTLSAVLGLIPSLPIPSSYVALFQLIPVINLIVSIVVVLAFDSWGFGHLIGWLCGTGLMASVGLVELWLFAIYSTVGIVVLVTKILTQARGYSR